MKCDAPANAAHANALAISVVPLSPKSEAHQMSSANLAKIVRAIVNNPDRDPYQIIRGMGGENLSREQLAAVFEMSVAEFLAQAEEWQHEAKQARAAAKLFEGLPKGIIFDDACRMKAAEGNGVAQRHLAAMNSRTNRVFEALFSAAVDLCPAWPRFQKNALYPMECRKLVEWFQTTHPREARKVEDSIK
jgi:hypothetical protein